MGRECGGGAVAPLADGALEGLPRVVGFDVDLEVITAKCRPDE